MHVNSLAYVRKLVHRIGNTDTHTLGQTDRQTPLAYTQTGRQTDRHTDRQTDRHTHTHTHTQVDTHTQTDRHRQTDRRTKVRCPYFCHVMGMKSGTVE